MLQMIFACGTSLLKKGTTRPLGTCSLKRLTHTHTHTTTTTANIAAAEGGSSGVALEGTPDECVSVGLLDFLRPGSSQLALDRCQLAPAWPRSI